MEKIGSEIFKSVSGVPVVYTDSDLYQQSSLVQDHFIADLGRRLIEIFYVQPSNIRIGVVLEFVFRVYLKRIG